MPLFNEIKKLAVTFIRLNLNHGLFLLQVAAVQAAVAQQQQQIANNGGGGHTPAPSPGPHPMYNASGPQSLPQQFPISYPNGVFIPPGPTHPSMMQQTMISPQGQGVPPPHPVHQFAMPHPHQGNRK